MTRHVSHHGDERLRLRAPKAIVGANTAHLHCPKATTQRSEAAHAVMSQMWSAVNIAADDGGSDGLPVRNRATNQRVLPTGVEAHSDDCSIRHSCARRVLSEQLGGAQNTVKRQSHADQ